MSPRKPPDTSEDEVQNEILQAVHEALSEALPVIVPADDRPVAGIRLEPSHPQDIVGVAALDAQFEIEIDRTEIYLKGPTAFTA